MKEDEAVQSLLENKQEREKRRDAQRERMRSSARLAVVLALILLLLAGGSCGYHLRPTGGLRGLGIQSLAIPMVKSPASTLGFEGDFTRIVREEFIDHSSLSMVSTDQADAVLIMRITRIGNDPLSYNVTQKNVQNRTINYAVTSSRWLWLKVNARLVDRTSGKVLWERRGIREKASYAVSPDPLETRYNRRLAIQTIARDVAKKVYAQTLERF